ncbi:SsgA family sporulation/cell division regulator [Streptomyces ferrugineus]|uniref:SsgA family sporulation/cell division regulator n=1 Tax=Streptomyces ferrugineus TaxID=1413221 RepID=A0A7M2SNX4_9ACTN|nr:SsgA family sporulation/cell division regulator [Streptomyces ferrugineus]QOV38077.1 SsgA family sporulation/cell division regulator [Streptomyces ferrugineus]
MRLALDQPVRARLATPDYPELPIRPTLRYCASDPFAVHIDFPAHVSADGDGVTWTFARSLLEEGLEAAVGIGDVRIRPYGRLRTVIEFHAPHGMAAIRFGTASLRRFLQRSYAVVEPGREDLGPELDHGLTSLLGGV